MPKLDFENYIPNNKEAFKKKVIDIADYLGVNPNWLMAIMWFESRLNPRARNKYTRATGLIQWMPFTAPEYGTTVDKLRDMSNLEQLDYVKRYFAKWRGKITDMADMYLIVFFPLALKYPDNWVLRTSKGNSYIIAKQNKGFDTNNDWKVTKKEVKDWFKKTVAKGGGVQYYVKEQVKRNILPLTLFGSLLLLGVGAFVYYNRKKIQKSLN